MDAHHPADALAAAPNLEDETQLRARGICPFLRGTEGPLAMPAGVAVEGQQCVAVGPPLAQSTSQQAMVCLRSAHADCPRYQRGVVASPERGARSRPVVPRATLAALMILVLSAGISLGYVVQRGGLDMPAAGPSSTDDAAAGVVAPSAEATVAPATAPPASPEATAELPSAGASAGPGMSPETSPPLTAEATPSPEPTATPRPTPKPTATPKPVATPKSDRYKLLVKCPDRSGCWIYTVRSGDNLFSIARYFGHPLATIYAWNPQYPGTRLKAGAEIRMPPPTR